MFWANRNMVLYWIFAFDEYRVGKMETVTGLIFLGSEITIDGGCSPEIKRRLIFGRKATTNLDSVLKSRHHFANKGPYSQSYGFPSNHVWELDHKEGWAPKNWFFQTVMLEKTLESPLNSKEIQPVSPKGNQPWVFIERTDAGAEAPVIWPADTKSWLFGEDQDDGKDGGQEKKGAVEYEMVGWHHRLSGMVCLRSVVCEALWLLKL